MEFQKRRGAAQIEPAIIRGCEDQSPTVQVIASWAFANLSDAMRKANIFGTCSITQKSSIQDTEQASFAESHFD